MMAPATVQFRPSLSWFAAQVAAGVIFLLLIAFTARVYNMLTLVFVGGTIAYCALEWRRLRLAVSADATGLRIGEHDPVFVPWAMVAGIERYGQRFRTVGRAAVVFAPAFEKSEAARRLGLWPFRRLLLPYMTDSADTVVTTLEDMRRNAAHATQA